MKHISVEYSGGIAEIVLGRPPVNALNEELVIELNETIREIDSQKEVRVVIISSSLSCFMAGADIKMMESIQKDLDTARMLEFVKNLQDTLTHLENMSKPTIAYINGHAMGGGLEVALACDFRIMALGKGRIGLPEIKLGMVPGAGGPQRLTRLLGETKAKELIYFGMQLSADQAYQIGLVSRVVEPESGMREVYKMAHELEAQAPIALAGIKRCIQFAGQISIKNGLDKEMEETEKVYTSNDSKIGFKAFLENSIPVFNGI